MKLLVFFIAGLLSLNSNAASAQIITSDSITTTESPSSSNSNNAAESSTVPGFYYEPTPQTHLDLTEMAGALDSGSIQTDYVDLNQEYNLQRAWPKGATPDAMTKVGDLTQDPLLKSVLNIDGLTLRSITGDDVELAPLKSIGLINSMSLGEFLAIFPQRQNQAIKDVVLLNESLENAGSILNPNSAIDHSEQLCWCAEQNRGLERAEKLLIERIARQPIFENIPFEAIVQGDWGESIESGSLQLLTQVLAKYPELKKVPIDKSFPLVDGVISGDWQSIVVKAREVTRDQGQQILTRQLLELVPELKDIPLGALPIDNLTIGDVESLADVYLSEVPAIENRYISQLGNLSQNLVAAPIDRPPIFTGDIWGRLDIAYAGEVENPVTHVLSGGTSHQKFQPEPCFERSCPHFEITDLVNPWGLEGDLQGKAWVQGTSQQVPGGKGFLMAVNGGQERTGVSVWSPKSHVKLSLEDIDEGGNGIRASARVWLNFQFCVDPPFAGEHCTPHFIPIPTPWKVQEGGLILIFSRDSPNSVLNNARQK